MTYILDTALAFRTLRAENFGRALRAPSATGESCVELKLLSVTFVMPSKAVSKAKVKPVKGGSAEPVQRPKWPPLHPLVPACDLSLDVVLEDQIILIRNLFTGTLCKQYVNFLSSLPLTTTPGQPSKGEALRVNDRFQVEDPAFAEHLWSMTSLKDLVTGSDMNWGGDVCGLNPRIRIYRYAKGQFFDQHCT
jgi:hypothetical protein